jgi:hypothetical protein
MEDAVQNALRMQMALFYGGALWRNNSGALPDKTGRIVRFGLGNDSAKLNAVWKSADLIGILPVTVTAEMVGQRLGLFVAVDAKDPSAWRGGPKSDRELAQENFFINVRQLGGIGGFATSTHDLERLLKP